MQQGHDSACELQPISHALQVEAAYDVILMQKMRDRLSGDVKASIKYADVPVKKNSKQVCSVARTPVIPTHNAPQSQTRVWTSALATFLYGGLLAVATLTMLPVCTTLFRCIRHSNNVAGITVQPGTCSPIWFRSLKTACEHSICSFCWHRAH